MKKWRQVGSVGSNHSRQNSEHRSARSRHDSPFQSFHQNLQNKSQKSLDAKDKTFCQQYMQKNKFLYHNMTMEMVRSERMISNKVEEDMFTEMRNVMKREPSLDSRVSIKTLSERQSKFESVSSKLKKKDKLAKTNSKLQGLKKQQKKLKKNMENQTAAIKNIFCQLDQVFHRFNNKPEAKPSSGQSYDPQMLKQIVVEAVSIEKYFAEMDRKKHDIMQELDG